VEEQEYCLVLPWKSTASSRAAKRPAPCGFSRCGLALLMTRTSRRNSLLVFEDAIAVGREPDYAAHLFLDESFVS
jgi:hypothetical protein